MSNQEKLVELDVPQSDVGAPMPFVLANENSLVVCYYLSDVDPNWDGTTVRVVSADTDAPVAILRVEACTIHTFGSPNDEAMHGHRLAKAGLRAYSAYEVLNSEWISALEFANRVHHHHRASMFASLRHFIFTFHDTTLEFVSSGYEIEVVRGSIRDVSLSLAAELLT